VHLLVCYLNKLQNARCNYEENQKQFKKYENKPSDAENITLTSMSTWHMGSRWYTPDFHEVVIDISELVPSWHQGLYSGVEKNRYQVSVAVRGQLALRRHLLPIACQPGATQSVKKHITQVAGRDTGTAGTVIDNLPGLTP